MDLSIIINLNYLMDSLLFIDLGTFLGNLVGTLTFINYYYFYFEIMHLMTKVPIYHFNFIEIIIFIFTYYFLN
jgi:hypothetical protein